MNIAETIDKIYVGIVESNVDPYRLGRVKVRVLTVYDNIPLEDIPYATPFKSTDGRTFNIPTIGKIVSVVFDNGNIYMPVYHYSENYNINLQKKLDSLNDEEYQNFIAFSYDHRCQHFIDKNGYRLDFLYNQIHIDEESINIRLKDNMNTLNLGSRDSNQDAVLGTNFFGWFDRFMEQMLIPTSMVDSNGSPIQKPEIDLLIQEYKQIKDTFISKHVKLPDNNAIEQVKRDLNTIAETHDTEVKVNKQSPFEPNKQNTFNSNILNESVKQEIQTINDTEQEKLNKAQPSNLVNIEQRDFDEDWTTPRTDIELETVDGTKTNYEEVKKNDSEFNNDAFSNNSVSNVNDTYGNDGTIIDDDNYGMYAVDTQSRNSSSNYNKPKVTTPKSITKTDENGNVVEDKVPIYVKGKLQGYEPYVMEQGKKIVKNYYEPLKQMLEAAKNDGVIIKLSEAYREYDEQLLLRKKHAKEDFTEVEYKTNSSNNYNPQTAIPGRSIHHMGAAFDFYVGLGRNKSYEWLDKNAIKFGFVRTLPKEVWHWEYQPWTYTGKRANDAYAFVGKNDASWMGISMNA